MTPFYNRIHENVWIHREEPIRALVVIALLNTIVVSIVALFFSTNADTVLKMFIALSLVIVIALLFLAKSTLIEIDRKKGTVNTTVRYLLFTRRRSIPLQEFDRVEMVAKDDPVEDGYRIVRYSIVLLGGKRSLELLSVDSEREGNTRQKELAEFLVLFKNQTI